jgi:phosphoribosyl-AMP cyclohydrolase / phosphoribosyl-ATP pyrophosphohydrolase
MKQVEDLDWNKGEGLLPAIIQDEYSQSVLMLGYMNQESFAQTLKTGLITFYSRSRKNLWVKGETSGHFLKMISWKMDCDRDTLLFQVQPQGATCHLGTDTCFGNFSPSLGFLNQLEEIINTRWTASAEEKSYVSQLAKEGIDRITQKVGEEAIEVVIAAKNKDQQEFEGEVADLLFHTMVLLKEKGTSLKKIAALLAHRHQKKIVSKS